MTPCVVGVGNPERWNGVPCKGDGYFEWSGVYLVDRLARTGLEATAREVVDAAPLGWDCLGGKPLSEPDDFLAPLAGRLDQTATAEVLGRHFTVYLLDLTEQKFHWRDAGQWSALPLKEGRIGELPGWYPKPPATKPAALLAMPAEVKKELQKRTLAWDLRWDVMLRAMRSWIAGNLALALEGSPPGWQVLDTKPPTHRVFVGEAAVWFDFESAGAELYGHDGRRHELDLSPQSAENALRGVLRESMVQPMVQSWLDLAWKQQHPEGSVSWAMGAKRWWFIPERVTIDLDDLAHHHAGVLPRVLAWLYG